MLLNISRCLIKGIRWLMMSILRSSWRNRRRRSSKRLIEGLVSHIIKLSRVLIGMLSKIY